MKKEILKKIAKLEKEHGIKVLLAVESGSREWGFASNDSDYDVRCVHVSPIDMYLSLDGAPEQAEIIKDDIDIVSWDVRKFFALFMKSNPTVSEWLSSREVYIDKGFGKMKQKELRKLFSSGFNRETLIRHYISLAKQNYKKYIDTEGQVLLKKYVYILRGLGCVEYIKRTDSLPPLDWKDSSKYLPLEIRKQFARLVALKQGSEENRSARNEALDRWIEIQFAQTIKEDKIGFDRTVIDGIVIAAINKQIHS